jgi:hypothetical protein
VDVSEPDAPVVTLPQAALVELCLLQQLHHYAGLSAALGAVCPFFLLPAAAVALWPRQHSLLQVCLHSYSQRYVIFWCVYFCLYLYVCMSACLYVCMSVCLYLSCVVCCVCVSVSPKCAPYSAICLDSLTHSSHHLSPQADEW